MAAVNASVILQDPSIAKTRTSIVGPSGSITHEENGFPLVHEGATIVEAEPALRTASYIIEKPVEVVHHESLPIVEAKSIIQPTEVVHQELPVVQTRAVIKHEVPVVSSGLPLVNTRTIVPSTVGFRTLQDPLWFRSGALNNFWGGYSGYYPNFYNNFNREILYA